MPEYLAPGVYVEEVSFRSKTIEGVATSTTGYAGMTRWGPVQYVDGLRRGPSTTEPRLITSYPEFERVFGGLDKLDIDRGDGAPSESYVAQAARAFFLNGGQRLYVSRVFVPRDNGGAEDWGISQHPVGALGSWRGRWPGSYGDVLMIVRAVRKGSSAYQHVQSTGPSFGTQARGLTRGAVVEISTAATSPAAADDLNPPMLAVIDVDNSSVDINGVPEQSFLRADGTPFPVDAASVIKEITLQITIFASDDRVDSHGELATHPGQRRWIGKIMQANDPESEDAIVYLDIDELDDLSRAITLLAALETGSQGVRLSGGHDGALAMATDLLGDVANPDDATRKATGLEALAEIDDIAIVALPDGGTYSGVLEPQCQAAADALMGHAERDRYRIAVVDAPRASSMNEVREFRGKFDSTRAALYHPWIEIFDPTERPAQGAPPRRLVLPPSGFVTGIYARNDITRGVFKAPANEVVYGLTKFEANINKARNDVLNPEGINALRFFEGRGSRVWGARTMSSDPEWKYVNVRRLFIFLEHSIDRAMQWAVFEPNNARLWRNITQMVEDFLYVQWLNGALLGSKPEEAFFVRCDRTTMTQNDLDNGRLICLIGVAPVKPAEFVIFRIGQWTADARI